MLPQVLTHLFGPSAALKSVKNYRKAHFSPYALNILAPCTLSRIIKRQVLTNSMVAILTFWSSTDSDHVRAVPVALLSITTNHSGARFWPQKEKTSASTFFSLSFVMIFIS